MKKILIALTMVTLLVTQACSDRKGKNYNKVNDDGMEFVNEAAQSGTAEIKLSELALKNSTNEEVKDFAKSIIAEQTETAKELADIALKGKFEKTDSISEENSRHLTSLADKQGVDFDKEYLQIMVHDHEHAIEVFKEGSQNSSSKLQGFATKHLAKLQSQLKQANAICTGLK